MNKGGNNKHPRAHTNAFVDLNGMPFLVAEYVDRERFQQIDRSLIKSEVFIDMSESMRALIDINIDDIGRRASDARLNIYGNNTKQKNLLKMINAYASRYGNQLNVLKRGILIRVNYQLENSRTGKVIRSMSEDLRIDDRNYFLDINPDDINNNAIVVNFNDTIVSTINEFTHGNDRMMFRITDIRMFYEGVKDGPKIPRIKPVMTSYPPEMLPTSFYDDIDLYNYHNQMQHRHIMGFEECNHGFGNEDASMISPSGWFMFNRFYRFDNGGKDIIIHRDEVYDPMNKVVQIPCGTVRVNRTFMINPGHRIIFKFSIWKNDITIASDTTEIARVLKAPLYDFNMHPGCNDNKHECDHEINPDYETILRELEESRRMNNKQNHAINRLIAVVRELQDVINRPPILDEPDEPSTEPPEEGDDSEDNETNCGCDHDGINKKIQEIESEIQNIKDASGNCECPQMIPISMDEIEAMFKNPSI